MLIFPSVTFYIFRNLSWFRLSPACLRRVSIPLHEWHRHSSFYFQPEPAAALNTIHGGRGRVCFGVVFPLSQLGHVGSFFSSSYTRKARPQSLHSYSLPGISLTSPAMSLLGTLLYHIYFLAATDRLIHDAKKLPKTCHVVQVSKHRQQMMRDRWKQGDESVKITVAGLKSQSTSRKTGKIRLVSHREHRGRGERKGVSFPMNK